ncbi:MAG: ParB N-terminal domain-containing protein [Solobacterium sp.]|nr:ParB N-terminal domain-containing protein [Solobacterium sp.]
MKNTYVSLGEITYTYKDPGERLINSISKRGIAIPVRVTQIENGYLCLDGHKRLSACRELANQNPKFLRIPVLIVNNYSKAGVTIWGNTKNQH